MRRAAVYLSEASNRGYQWKQVIGGRPCSKTDFRAFRPNPVPAAPRIGCKNAVDDSPQIGAGPVRLEQYLMRTGESFETGIERGAGVLPRHVEPQRRVSDRLHHRKRILEPMTQLVDVVMSRFRPRAF